MLSTDLRAEGWLENIPGTWAVVVIEGVSMYLRPEELQRLLCGLGRRFEHVSVLMDCYSGFAARLSRYKNPINTVGVREVYGIDDPNLPVRETGLTYVCEHEMTPQRLIDELSGTERHIFRHIFSGAFARQLYRLHEYHSL